MGQIWHVLACLSAGLVAGALCEPLSAIFFLTRSKAVKIAADVLCGIVTALVFVLIFTAFALPDLRPYMLFFCGAGFWLWRRSFHRILDFFANKLYNKYRSSCKRIWLRLSRKLCRKKNSKNLS